MGLTGLSAGTLEILAFLTIAVGGSTISIVLKQFSYTKKRGNKLQMMMSRIMEERKNLDCEIDEEEDVEGVKLLG